MTIGDLLLSLPFDGVWAELQRLYDHTDKQRPQYADAYAELCSLASLPLPDDETPSPFVVTLTDVTPEGRDESACYMDVSCYRTDEPTRESYGIDLTPWRDSVRYGLGDNSADATTAAHVLYELTFCGYSAAEIDAKSGEIRGMLDDMDAGVADVHGPYVSIDDLFDSIWASDDDCDDEDGGHDDAVLATPWGAVGDDYDDDRRTGEELYD